jgi:TonB-dependent starch-binding outer membrane protein SusC
MTKLIFMKKSIGFIVLLLCSYVAVFAQVKIKGKITDAANGSPLAGATIKVRGENSSAVSAPDGSFELTAKSGSTLDISEVGHLSQTVKYTGQGDLEIKLVQDQKSLSEVVVTGVGVATSRKKLAIDVASLNIKDAGKSAVASVEQALQGKIAGANVQFTSGTPGSAAKIVLRGINDLSGNGPIILVDGIEVQGGLTGLDLSSIEKIEVVKGAAGGTLYGAQGANGVIQLFTKKGTRNKKPVINIQSQITSDQVLRGKELLANKHSYTTDNEGFIVNATGQRLAPDSNNAWQDPIFSDAGASAYTAANTKNDKPYREPIYDHIGQAYQKAITSNTNLTIAGGADNSDYAFAIGFLKQQNVLYNGYKRLNLGSNLGFTLAKGFNVRSNTQLIYTDEDLLSGGNRFNLTNSWRFIDFTAKDSKGNTVVKPKLNENQLNPLTEREWRTRGSKTIRILQNVNLNYKFNRFAELDYKYGIEFSSADLNNFYQNQRTAPQSGAGFWGSTVDGSITSSFNKFTYQNSLATAYLKFDFAKDFKINIPLNSTTQISYDWRKIQNRSYFAQGSILPSYPPYNIGVATTKTGGDVNSSFATYGTLINQTFDYGKLFGVSGGIRSDYSSEFGEAKKAQTFYRGTAYFRPSELLNSSWIGDWKLRAAYGEAGIQPFTALAFARQLVFNVTTVGVGGVGLGLPSQSANAQLKLATTNELEIGSDASFKTGFKTWLTRFNISATYWKRKAVNSYQFADLSPSTGSAQIFDNLTTLASKGFDFSLDADIMQTENFSWNVGFRYGQFDVVAEKISNNADVVAGIFALKEGQKVGSFFSQYPLSSIDQLKADKTRYIAEADKGKYEIVNGMVVDTATKKVFITNPNDTKLAGVAYPKFNASFINNFTILKNISLSLQFDWRYGSSIYNLTRQWLYRDRLSADYDKPVTIGGQTGAFVSYYNSLYNNVSPSSWFVESASMLRLRDASLSYNVSEKHRPKWLKAAAITIAARNLFTITKYTGLDPEATNTNDAQGNAAVGIGAINGVDLFGVPNLKTYIITLNFGF